MRRIAKQAHVEVVRRIWNFLIFPQRLLEEVVELWEENEDDEDIDVSKLILRVVLKRRDNICKDVVGNFSEAIVRASRSTSESFGVSTVFTKEYRNNRFEKAFVGGMKATLLTAAGIGMTAPLLGPVGYVSGGVALILTMMSPFVATAAGVGDMAARKVRRLVGGKKEVTRQLWDDLNVKSIVTGSLLHFKVFTQNIVNAAQAKKEEVLRNAKELLASLDLDIDSSSSQLLYDELLSLKMEIFKFCKRHSRAINVTETDLKTLMESYGEKRGDEEGATCAQPLYSDESIITSQTTLFFEFPSDSIRIIPDIRKKKKNWSFAIYLQKAGDSSSYQTKRFVQDFEYLYYVLVGKYQVCVLPPHGTKRNILGGIKGVCEKSTFERMVFYLLDHPVYKYDEDFQLFLYYKNKYHNMKPFNKPEVTYQHLFEKKLVKTRVVESTINNTDVLNCLMMMEDLEDRLSNTISALRKATKKKSASHAISDLLRLLRLESGTIGGLVKESPQVACYVDLLVEMRLNEDFEDALYESEDLKQFLSWCLDFCKNVLEVSKNLNCIINFNKLEEKEKRILVEKYGIGITASVEKEAIDVFKHDLCVFHRYRRMELCKILKVVLASPLFLYSL